MLSLPLSLCVVGEGGWVGVSLSSMGMCVHAGVHVYTYP